MYSLVASPQLCSTRESYCEVFSFHSIWTLQWTIVHRNQRFFVARYLVMHEKYYCRGRLTRREVQSTLFLLLKGRLIACSDTFAMNFITEEQIAIF